MPRAYLEAHKALTLLGRHTEARYAVTARRLEGLVGPFAVGQKVGAQDLLEAVAQATGAELSRRGEVAVLQPPLESRGFRALTAELGGRRSGAPEELSGKRRALYALGETLRLEAVPHLVAALGEKDRAVRRTALLALAGLEGDFEHNGWPGRVSVFELPGVKLDTDTLMWLVEEAAPAGGTEWRAAVSVLGRAREAQLPRSVWWKPWNKTQGAIMPSIWAMGRCGDPDMRRTLDKRIRNTFTNVHTDRFITAAALGQMGMVSTLRKHAEGKYPALVRCAAAYGLGFCAGSKTALETLEKMLADRDSRVREVAVFALCEMDTPEALGKLTGALLDEKADPTLRAAAAAVLGRVAVDEFEAIAADKLVAAATKDKDPRVRAAVAEALGEMGGLPAGAVLVRLLTKDGDRWVQAAAGRALASLGAIKEVPWDAPGFDGPMLSPLTILSKLLIDSKTDVELCTAIALGMGQGRSPEYAEPLSKVALDPKANWRLRKYAARSLAMLADRAGQPALKRLLESDSAPITDIPLRYLDLGDAARTVEYLAPWVTRGRGRHQQSCAAERIGELGVPAGVGLLAAGFNAFDNYTRCAQIFSLQSAEDATSRRTLIDLMKSRRAGVRMNAALALGGSRDPEAIAALMEACTDQNAEVRMAAVNSLGECGDPASAAALIKMMRQDENTSVVHQALRALRQKELASLPEVKEALESVRGSDRDCGVPGGPPVWDQLPNSWVLRKYYRSYDDLSLPNLTYESTICYEPTSRRIIQWGAHGRRADAPQTGMTWILDPEAQRWIRPAPREEPPGTCCNRDIALDPSRSLAVSPKSGMGGHGWVMSLRKYASRSVPWVYDVKKGQWYPMRPAGNPGSHGMVATCYDALNDAIIVHGSREQVYDTHANRWTTMRPPAPRPREHSQQPGAYDPVTGRFVMLADVDARGRGRTWAYELAANRWTELKPQDPPPAVRVPMVYDSANDVMLVFGRGKGRLTVYVYHPRENRWEEMPATYPAPSYRMTDAVYDPVHNVTWLIGGWEWGSSGAVTTRETWTYRYRRPVRAPKSTRPRDLRLEIPAVAGVARVDLSWKEPEAGAPGGYHVYHGTGKQPWTARFVRLTKAPVTGTRLSHTGGVEGYYRVRAVGADGKEGTPSYLVRTHPLPVRRVFAARGFDGSVKLSWEPSAGPAVVGYNLYRAAGKATDLWRRPFSYNELDGKFVKVNKKLVKGTAFTDRRGEKVPPASESRWAPLQVYVVKAVNSLALESGPGPATLSIPAAPGPVMVARLGDGRRMVLSEGGGSAVRGNHIYRLDVYKGDLIFRLRGAPHAGGVFIDDEAWPRGHRRQYFVVGVDEAGQLGVPSSPGWEELP